MIKRLKPAFILLILLLSVKALNAQVPKNITDYLSQKFTSFVSSVPREEIYIQSDREEYISGETIWFNTYLIDRQNMKPDSQSSIAYFELLNPDNRPIVQKKILLVNDCGPGQIILPDTLSTGIYTIRAYTNWMKNFLPFNCFVKTVRVYNSFSNKIYKGKMISGNNRSSNGKISTDVAIKVDNFKPDVVEILIQSNGKYRSSNNNQIYIFIQTHGIINHLSLERITEDNERILIPKQQLIEGINQITLFDSQGHPVAERYIYTPVKTYNLTLSGSDSTKMRNKIALDLDYGSGNAGNLSISVQPVGTRRHVADLREYLILGSEFVGTDDLLRLNGIDEIPLKTIDSLLLSVKSNWIEWEKILTDKLPGVKYQIESEDHYINGRLLTKTGKEAMPDRFVIMSIPGKIPVFQYATTDKNGNFSFKVHIDNKVNDLIIQPDVLAKNAFVSIESPFSDIYFQTENHPDTTEISLPDYISDRSVNQQVQKIYSISATGDPVKLSFPAPLIRRFYGTPDVELKMKDYIALPVMEEVFFELLAGVSLKNKKTGYEISMADPNNFKKPYDLPPGLFIDGVMIEDAGMIAKMEPESVEKIDVVREKYFVGDYQFFGVVNLITKTGDFSLPGLPDDAIRLSYQVIDPVYRFFSPDYSSTEKKTKRIPDLRNTLYWNPNIDIDASGHSKVEFWTSDFISDYIVSIQGITKEGKIISLKKTIKVGR